MPNHNLGLFRRLHDAPPPQRIHLRIYLEVPRGGPISLGSLKKGHQILKGGVQWSDGGVQYISLTRTTNLAYLDAKE